MKKNFEQSIYSNSDVRLFNIRKIPKKYRDDIFKLYSFLKITSDLKGQSSQGASDFKYIIRRWQGIKREDSFGHYTRLDDSKNERVLANIAYLTHRYDINPKIVDDYLRSIAIDMRLKTFHSAQDTLKYLQYSSESIGEMLVKIMQLPNAVSHYAKMQARATKYIQLILSVPKNSSEGRCYLPTSEMKKLGLSTLELDSANKSPEAFKKFIQLQLKRYEHWQEEARKGDEYIPKKLRQLIKRSRADADLVAKIIERDPLMLFSNNLKPKLRHRLRASIKR